MKKILLASLISFSLANCGDSASDSGHTETSRSSSDSSLNPPYNNTEAVADTSRSDTSNAGNNVGAGSGMTGANGRPGAMGGAATGGTTGGSRADSASSNASPQP